MSPNNQKLIILIEKPRKSFPFFETILITIFIIIGLVVVFLYLIPGFIEYHENPLYNCKLLDYSSEQGLCGDQICYVAQFNYDCENYNNITYSGTFYKTDENSMEYKDVNGLSLLNLEGNAEKQFHIDKETGTIDTNVESLTVLILVTVFVGIMFIVLGYLTYIYIIGYFRNPYLPEVTV